MIHSTPSGDIGAAAKGFTVLVVEDEVLLRLSVSETLRSAGYIVLEAATSDEAKALLATIGDIALIFSDIQMPGTMDGAELARFLRSTYPTLGIILTSGAVAHPLGDDETVEFLAKPYAPEDVVKRVKDLLE